MTTAAHRDWKVTPGYRTLVRLGWALVALAVYLAGAAAILDAVVIWWAVAGLAAVAVLTGLMLPEPVPSSMLNTAKSHVEARRA